MEDLKVCVGCQDSWPADEQFYKTGQDICNACSSEGVRPPKKPKTRGHRTPEQASKHQKEKYQRHKEEYKARMRRWYAANKDEHNARRRARRIELRQMKGEQNGLNV